MIVTTPNWSSLIPFIEDAALADELKQCRRARRAVEQRRRRRLRRPGRHPR